MNTGWLSHIPEDLLERYAIGRLPDPDCAALDEHLLICSACQISLEEMDEYVHVVKAAIAALPRTLKRPPQRAYGLNVACETWP